MKLPNWEQRLLDYYNSIVETSLEWGENDCAEFVKGAIRAQCGAAVTHGKEGQYFSYKDATNTLTHRLAQDVGAAWGLFDDIQESNAQMGDIGGFYYPDGSFTLAINMSPYFGWATIGPHGPREMAACMEPVQIWRI